ncbi:SRPBCC family protein [Mycobacterium antarcticum]|uniref:SRPBCC family protein n=1 Tax=Mycolicibacterium sp. TUM20984 TaxID=3023368 RepID=UPI0023A1257E|nr:SRPBCC family protein [Mycolicibacterium sp. TUM20984]GLP82788.1 hypothetical protein TUM20984_42080 [Mycolicibacterium sp. TUM20984]
MRRDLGPALAGAAALYAARRYYRNWGATKQESHARMPGDGLIHEPAAQSTSAEWIDVPIESVWPRVLKATLHQQDADPVRGEIVQLRLTRYRRIAMSVVEGVDGRSLVLRTVPRAVPIDVTWAWSAESRWDDRTRVIVRLRIALRHPGDVLVAEAAGPIIAVLTRRRLAEIGQF